MLLVQVLLVKYVQGLRSFTVGGGPNFSSGVHILQQNKFRGVLIFRKISSGGGGGNQFWGVHFYHDRDLPSLLPYSGKFSLVKIFAKIPFPLHKKFMRF